VILVVPTTNLGIMVNSLSSRGRVYLYFSFYIDAHAIRAIMLVVITIATNSYSVCTKIGFRENAKNHFGPTLSYLPPYI
jgi:hypothetical protein